MVQLFEADRLAATEEVFGQYVRALAKADKLNGTALMQTLYRGAQSFLGHAGGGAAPSPAYAAARSAAVDSGSFASSALRGQGGAFGALGGGVEPGMAAAASTLGSAKNPLYMMQAEPTFWSQLWRRCEAALLMLPCVSFLCTEHSTADSTHGALLANAVYLAALTVMVGCTAA